MDNENEFLPDKVNLNKEGIFTGRPDETMEKNDAVPEQGIHVSHGMQADSDDGNGEMTGSRDGSGNQGNEGGPQNLNVQQGNGNIGMEQGLQTAEGYGGAGTMPNPGAAPNYGGAGTMPNPATSFNYGIPGMAPDPNAGFDHGAFGMQQNPNMAPNYGCGGQGYFYGEGYDRYPEQGGYEREMEIPVTVGEWLLTMLLMLIPCVNIVLLLVWAFGDKEKKSKSNYFKARLIYYGIMIGLSFFWLILYGFILLLL